MENALALWKKSLSLSSQEIIWTPILLENKNTLSNVIWPRMYDKFSISRAFDGQIVLSVKMTFSLYTVKS